MKFQFFLRPMRKGEKEGGGHEKEFIRREFGQ